MVQRRQKVLMELRPALEGFAGIPQETRLLFAAFQDIETVECWGLINHGGRRLSKAIDPRQRLLESRIHKRINRLSRFVVSVKARPHRTLFQRIEDMIDRWLGYQSLKMQVRWGRPIRLYDFNARNFGDFMWGTFFSKTLPASEFDKIRTAQFKTIRPTWKDMNLVGMSTGIFTPRFARLDTRGFDVFLSQTPWPGTVTKPTKLVVRYHDAIPMFLPHTISNVGFHQHAHYRSLVANAKQDAHFVCTSEDSRGDLLKIFPQVEKRTTVIHDVVSHHYYYDEAKCSHVAEIIRNRIEAETEPKFLTSREKSNFYKRHINGAAFPYVMMVSTIEPRKNHSRLIGAWEYLKTNLYPDLKLVVVGQPGWDFDLILRNMRGWQDRGELFNLSRVPAGELRLLYNGAAAVVCASVAEGFDLSGIEAMLCGGAVVASDIPVHREVYGDACEYFNPYSTIDAAQAIDRVISPNAQLRRRELIQKGLAHGKQYSRENTRPKWQEYFETLARA
jgi:hypothetical protein